MAAELDALDQSKSGVSSQHVLDVRHFVRLTVHDDVVSLPEEELLVHERRLGNGRSIFPILPIGPVLSKVDAVPQLLGTQGIVSEHEAITALGERGGVVFGIGEHHDIVLLALSNEEMVGSLIAQARRLAGIQYQEAHWKEINIPLFQLHPGSLDF